MKFMKPKVIVYSDYICPFCFIGKDRIDKLEEEFDVDVEWRGYEIHPETPVGGSTIEDLNMDESYMKMMKHNIIKMADEAGLDIKFPSKLSNSRLALEMSEYAGKNKKFNQFNNAVFKAYWQEDVDIGQLESLFKIAETVGLALTEFNEYLKDGRAKKKLNKYINEAAKYNITGVPTFIIGNNIIVGAQPYEKLKQAVEEKLIMGGIGNELT